MSSRVPLFVDIDAWVEEGKSSAVEYRRRQATHIILAAIAKIFSPYPMYLKGGLLLGLVYNSPRMTTDIDFTAGFGPKKDSDTKIEKALNEVFPVVIAELGYVGSQAKVGRIKLQPRLKKGGNPLEEASFPALGIIVNYNSGPSDQWKEARVSIDLSFNEPYPQHIDILGIGEGIEVPAYSLVEIIAEKYRALLQQVTRRRGRRQDVYDIDFLLHSNVFDSELLSSIHTSLINKCHSREIFPEITSLDNPKVRDQARQQWDTIELETGFLSEFDHCFENVRQFYKKLAWDK
ncbi:nucleotidyl transferase AbiEii/AbiGii toxin family protein [Candidatus Poribacteria bacterium]|nr:nucleotidyl transferase AbiEii/AbiGii toxin family protein [Candidatus Poribacteria bacterium]